MCLVVLKSMVYGKNIQVHTVVFCSLHTNMMFVSVCVHPYDSSEGLHARQSLHGLRFAPGTGVISAGKCLSVRRVGLSPACFLPFVRGFGALGASASKDLQSDSLKL